MNLRRKRATDEDEDEAKNIGLIAKDEEYPPTRGPTYCQVRGCPSPCSSFFHTHARNQQQPTVAAVAPDVPAPQKVRAWHVNAGV